MPIDVGNILSQQTPASVGRPWYHALGVSTLAHVSVILLLSGFASSGLRQQEASVDTRWTADDADQQLTQTAELLSTSTTPTTLAAGGSRAAAASTLPPRRLQVTSPSSNETSIDGSVDQVLMSGALADDVGILLTASTGDSTGSGAGEGDGQGDGFFGIGAQGKRFVYVVDCSLSMNHPHASPSKTRFKRLKLELVKSIAALNESQEFFIIFFNQQVVPMPARSMQRALPETKQRFLKWVTKIRADGDTDPRDAIRLAMKFQPDVIYFLTDGSFEFRTKKELNKLAQQRVSIHTFALGNREGEPILRGLADRNRGIYHYIP
ncbi:MAG: VWA domain-containing protein [Planctomycetaceae bacterium]|nr:VWA domain-containing protein [Planctomycetaceae bacterium]MBT6486839.1 VWA domain-containing protein [Planctomycetaceae bacterium]MBT6498160.1 VWA domain-containing protein [Planctomycetaceae bacterium]